MILMLDLCKSDVTLITVYQVNNYEKNVVRFSIHRVTVLFLATSLKQALDLLVWVLSNEPLILLE